MSLIVNPLVSVRAPEADASSRLLTVSAPVRGRGLQVHTIDLGSEPGVFSALLVHLATGGARGIPTDLADAERARLRAIGFLVEPGEVSTPVAYACDLDSADAKGDQSEGGLLDASALVVNPTLVQLGGDGPTRAMRGRVKLPNPFERGRSWLTVEADRPMVRRLFSFSQAANPHLSELVPGAPLPALFSPELTRRLVAAGVAGSPASMRSLEDRRRASARELGTRLVNDRMVMFDSLIDPFQLGAIRRYYRAATEEGFIRFGDSEWPNRYYARYDPIAHFFHEQCAAVVSEIAGEPFKASFPFYASYHPGSELKAHRDREQCVLSVSVQLDHDPEPSGHAPWPIYLQASDATTSVPVTMGLGDAAMFYGQEVRHWREVLTEGWSSFWFLFYVPESFTGPLD